MANENPQSAAPMLKYNPQFDGLRFCAVLIVVSYHWLPAISHQPIAPFFGGLVNFFFVLSSYLITRILFSAKEKSVTLGISKFKVMGVYLMRRTIRIFPAYYFFLLLVLLIPTVGMEVKHGAGMYFAYLANYQIFSGHDFPSVTAHIWTLAVEEQFYLLWPLVILFIPRKHLLKTLLFIIVSTVALRAIYYYPAPGVPQAILTQYCVDAFAVGALLAYKCTAPEAEQRIITKFLNVLVYAGIPIGIAIIFTQNEYWSFVFNRLLFSLVSMKVIEGAIAGYKNNFGKFLEQKAVVYLGRISYGIYLYHLLVPVLFWRLYHIVYGYEKAAHAGYFALHKKDISAFVKFLTLQPVGYVIYAGLTILIAVLSSKFIEKPISKLKVSYNVEAKKSAVTPPAQHSLL